jgi:hypothetical protein
MLSVAAAHAHVPSRQSAPSCPCPSCAARSAPERRSAASREPAMMAGGRRGKGRAPGRRGGFEMMIPALKNPPCASVRARAGPPPSIPARADGQGQRRRPPHAPHPPPPAAPRPQTTIPAAHARRRPSGLRSARPCPSQPGSGSASVRLNNAPACPIKKEISGGAAPLAAPPHARCRRHKAPSRAPRGRCDETALTFRAVTHGTAPRAADFQRPLSRPFFLMRDERGPLFIDPVS